MKKELIWLFYLILTILLAILFYIFSKSHKFDYSLLGIILGVLISIILWITWGYKLADS